MFERVIDFCSPWEKGNAALSEISPKYVESQPLSGSTSVEGQHTLHGLLRKHPYQKVKSTCSFQDKVNTVNILYNYTGFEWQHICWGPAHTSQAFWKNTHIKRWNQDNMWFSRQSEQYSIFRLWLTAHLCTSTHFNPQGRPFQIRSMFSNTNIASRDVFLFVFLISIVLKPFFLWPKVCVTRILKTVHCQEFPV